MRSILLMLLCGLAALSVAGQSARRPNVIIVLSDDQGYGDFSCHGNPVLQTPALDRMYNESVRLTNFHVTPLCTPTRGELMSGLAAMNNKASNVLTGRGIVRRDVTIMPEVFSQNGYHTGIFGKWHLGDTYPDRPIDRGFQKSIWTKGWGLLSEIEYDNDYYKTRYMDSLDIKYSEQYCTDLWFDQAMKWMDNIRTSGKPFFTYIPLNAPHGPFYAPEDDAKRYRDKAGDDATASFLGMISNIDRNMARLDQWLTEKGLKENTIVIFMNDNGGTGGVKVYNAGMRGEKTSTYDGGHRAACFIQWPSGSIGLPRSIGYAASVRDLLPTFIDLFGFKIKQKTFDGISLRPVLQEAKKLKDRMFVVQYTGKEKPEKYYSCVVWNSWRLVGDSELYDIATDSAQAHNIATAHPDVLKKMKGFYETWWAGLQPEIYKLVPIIIGAKQENPVIINSNSWVGAGGINTQWGVAQAAGAPRGGSWQLFANEGGAYQVELSRWPFHLEREMTRAGPAVAIGGTKIREGKALPVAAGSLVLDSGEQLILAGTPGATKLSTTVTLQKGAHQLQAWFRDKDGKDLCGAYYVRITKL
ncbi:MAG: arylsulfatase [Chitinophagaceae bacterium]